MPAYNRTSTLNTSYGQNKYSTFNNIDSGGQHSELDDIIQDLIKVGDESYRCVTPEYGSFTTQGSHSRTVLSWQTNDNSPSRQSTLTRRGTPRPKMDTPPVEKEMTRKYESLFSKSSTDNWDTMDSSYNSWSKSDTWSKKFSKSEHDDWSTMNSVNKEPPAPPPRRYVLSPPLGQSSNSYTNNDYVLSERTSAKRSMHDFRNYSSDNEGVPSWLEEKQSKLYDKLERKPYRQRSQQEKQLIKELGGKQTYSDTEDYPRYDSKSRTDRRHPPDCNYYSLRQSDDQLARGYRTERKYYVSGFEWPPFTTQQTKYTFSITDVNANSQQNSTTTHSKPPPSPLPYKAPSSPVVSQRSQSSRDAVIRALTPKQDEMERERRAGLLQAPYPTDDEEVEEEIFSLQPIGPGLQSLEPDDVTNRTLLRTPTPSFPVHGAARPITPSRPSRPGGTSTPVYRPEVENMARKVESSMVHQSRPPGRSNRPDQHQARRDPMYSTIDPSVTEDRIEQQLVTKEQRQKGHQYSSIPTGPAQSKTLPNYRSARLAPQTQQSPVSHLPINRINQVPNQSGVPPAQGRPTPIGQQSMTPKSHPQQHQQQHGRYPTSTTEQYFEQTVTRQNYSADQSYPSNQPRSRAPLTLQMPGSTGLETVQSNNTQGPYYGRDIQNGNLSGSLTVDTRAHSSQNYLSPLSGGSGQSIPSPGATNTLQSRNLQSFPGSPYLGHSRLGSLSSLEGSDGFPHVPKFVKGTSKYWHKPDLSREEAIELLKHEAPGSFVVRNSNSFPGAYGLAVKVAQLPPNVQTKGGDRESELVRHFLIEPTNKGVRLKGCNNEPIFASLAALVYQHSVTPLALPCKLVLPDPNLLGEDFSDSTLTMAGSFTQSHSTDAACNVLYLNSADTESLTGPEALSLAIKTTLGGNASPKMACVRFKVSPQGITLTDVKRRVFFRRFYPLSSVSYCALDPKERRWQWIDEETKTQKSARVFGFVAKKRNNLMENSCHLFVELDPDQPATAIVSFVTRIMNDKKYATTNRSTPQPTS